MEGGCGNRYVVEKGVPHEARAGTDTRRRERVRVQRLRRLKVGAADEARLAAARSGCRRRASGRCGGLCSAAGSGRSFDWNGGASSEHGHYQQQECAEGKP